VGLSPGDGSFDQPYFYALPWPAPADRELPRLDGGGTWQREGWSVQCCRAPETRCIPYIAHSRGWTAEDMERNVAFVQQSESLHNGARELAARAVTMAKVLLATQIEPEKVCRGGRKGSQPMAPESPAEVAAMIEG